MPPAGVGFRNVDAYLPVYISPMYVASRVNSRYELKARSDMVGLAGYESTRITTMRIQAHWSLLSITSHSEARASIRCKISRIFSIDEHSSWKARWRGLGVEYVMAR